MASRYLFWNGMVASAFLLVWGGAVLCKIQIPSDIVAWSVAFLVLCFYACARLNLPEEPRWALAVSLASCVLWTFWTLLAGLLPAIVRDPRLLPF